MPFYGDGGIPIGALYLGGDLTDPAPAITQPAPTSAAAGYNAGPQMLPNPGSQPPTSAAGAYPVPGNPALWLAAGVLALVILGGVHAGLDLDLSGGD